MDVIVKDELILTNEIDVPNLEEDVKPTTVCKKELDVQTSDKLGCSGAGGYFTSPIAGGNVLNSDIAVTIKQEKDDGEYFEGKETIFDQCDAEVNNYLAVKYEADTELPTVCRGDGEQYHLQEVSFDQYNASSPVEGTEWKPVLYEGEIQEVNTEIPTVCKSNGEQCHLQETEWKPVLYEGEIQEVDTEIPAICKSDGEQYHLQEVCFRQNKASSLVEETERKPEVHILEVDLTSKRKNHLLRRRYECNFCSKYFVGKNPKLQLVKHEQTHHGNYKCKYCELSFQLKMYLKAHIMQAHKVKRPKTYSCNKCWEVFDRQLGLQIHRRFDHKPAPRYFRCKRCRMAFTTRFDLGVHEREHNRKNKKNLICDFCKKVYHQPGQLLFHIRKHLGLPAYSCLHCKKFFRSRDSRALHVNSDHPAINRHVCNRCRGDFSSAGSLSYHLTRIHGVSRVRRRKPNARSVLEGYLPTNEKIAHCESFTLYDPNNIKENAEAILSEDTRDINYDDESCYTHEEGTLMNVEENSFVGHNIDVKFNAGENVEEVSQQ